MAHVNRYKLRQSRFYWWDKNHRNHPSLHTTTTTRQVQEPPTSSSTSLSIRQGTVTASTMAQCTTCFDGSEPTNLQGETLVGNTSCAFFHDLALQTFEGTQGCQLVQINSYQGCGCTSYDEELFCTMCEDAFYDIPYRPKMVPLFPSRPDCADLLFTRRDDEERSCQDVRRAAYHCRWTYGYGSSR